MNCSRFVLLLLFITVLFTGCVGGGDVETTTLPPTDTPPPYPFEGQNMFFGLTMLSMHPNPVDRAIVEDLGISWVSLQPHVPWFAIEAEPGVYDWSDLDSEVSWLQSMGIDITMVLSPAMNAFGEKREILENLLLEKMATTQYTDPISAMISLMRDDHVSIEYELYPHGDSLDDFADFISAAVERYDGDGIDDMPGLSYAVRNWHFIEEYPMPGWSDVDTYIEALKAVHGAIKGADPTAQVIIPGLAGNYGRMFAFVDGYIEDDDAGVWGGIKFRREVLLLHPFIRQEKEGYEQILSQCDYYDIVDIHLYEPKETFLEGKLAWLHDRMEEYNCRKPIWVCEGGGPFKNAPGDDSPQGDTYFGFWTPKENAEFVVKLFVMSAANGVERQRWGLRATEGGYWHGPWEVMSLLESDWSRKPSYYTYKLLCEEIGGFNSIKEVGKDDLKIYECNVDGAIKYIVWDREGGVFMPHDLSEILGSGQYAITYIITELEDGEPMITPTDIVPSSAIPLGITPIIIEKN